MNLNHQQSVMAGATLIGLGSWLLYQTFEGSGRHRPFWVKFVPGI